MAGEGTGTAVEVDASLLFASTVFLYIIDPLDTILSNVTFDNILVLTNRTLDYTRNG